MTDQTKKIDLVSKAYSEIMEVMMDAIASRGSHPSTKLEKILTDLVEEAMAAREVHITSNYESCCMPHNGQMSSACAHSGEHWYCSKHKAN